MGIGNFIQIIKPTDVNTKQHRCICINKKGEATLCWKKDNDPSKTTPSIITNDPEIIIGMLRIGGQIRMNTVGADGSIAKGTNLINGDRKDIVRAFVYGFETTVPDLFVRSNWHKSDPPTAEELKAIGHLLVRNLLYHRNLKYIRNLLQKKFLRCWMPSMLLRLANLSKRLCSASLNSGFIKMNSGEILKRFGATNAQ